MAIEIVVESKLEKEEEREQFSSYLKQLCEKKQLKIEDYDTSVIIEVCPYGYIECSYEGRFVSLASESDVAGPGFHAYVCSFIDEVIADNNSMKWEVSDPAKYYEERNFENLKYGTFYRWLRDIREYAGKNEINEICWNNDFYRPSSLENHLVTPLGYISLEDFLNRDIEDLANDFFIWNTQERDARFYRNCALALLCKDGFFSYSAMNEFTDKMANTIIDYLEAAYEKDDTEALPMKEYRLLCNAIYRQEAIKHANLLELHNAGYRKNTIYYPFGNWDIPMDGFAEKSFDKSTQTMHFMAPYKSADTPWEWMVKVNSYTFDAEVSNYVEAIKHPSKETIEEFSICSENCDGKGIVENLGEYLRILVQFNHEHDMLFIEGFASDEASIHKLKTYCEQVVHQVREEETIKN